MHTRRLVAFILGVWLGGLLFIAYTTNANSSITAGIIENPPEASRQMIALAGAERIATLFRLQSAELSRSIMESWEWVQLALGLGLVCTLPFALRLKWLYLIAAGVMFAIVIAQRTLLTPEMIGLGRMLDMAGGTVWTQDDLWKQRSSLHTLQQLYVWLEVAKGLLGFGLTGALLVFRRKATFKTRAAASGARRDKSDSLADSDFSHIDG